MCLGSTAYLVFPGRTNILLIGIDYADPGSSVARTDTIILTTFVPLKRTIGMLSVPRDLWVNVPGIGDNRINTAHFYAESSQPGSGPQAVMDTIEQNFRVKMDYYLRIRFEGFREVVDSLGGVDIVLTQPMAGYPTGRHHLSGHKALAFVRDRANSDDFFRMANGQFMIESLFLNMLNPLKWPRLPLGARAFFNSIDTNIPTTMWPRLLITLLITGPGRIENQIITREMVSPIITDQGANVLLPNWDLIHLLVEQIF
jgi:LCP family protein required for cell wall assembly